MYAAQAYGQVTSAFFHKAEASNNRKIHAITP
jgi:hypothetical protein